MCWKHIAYFGFCFKRVSFFSLAKIIILWSLFQSVIYMNFGGTMGNLNKLNVNCIKALFNLLPSTAYSPHTLARVDKVSLVSQNPAEPHLSQIPSSLTVYVMVSSVSCDLTSARVSIVRKRAFNIVNLKENTGQTDA